MMFRIGKRKSKPVIVTTVRLSQRLHHEIEKSARANERSVNSEIVSILEWYIQGDQGGIGNQGGIGDQGGIGHE
jgi:predicted HicB family RNase H-like nuclease